MEKDLSEKVALVTGGSRGIGRAISEHLASRGAHVWINFRSGEAEAQETASLCEQAGGQASIIGFDIADSNAVDSAISRVKDESGRLDVLVNNAGISKDGLFVRLKNEDWDQTLQTNLTGAFYAARAAAKIMMKARTGRIVNISSIVGEMGNVGQASYVSSKAGMLGLTKALSRELASRGITVNAVTPGFIETDMTNSLDEKVRAEHLRTIPLGRYGRAEEVAALVGFLSSDHAAYITGQVIGINGGMYM